MYISNISNNSHSHNIKTKISPQFWPQIQGTRKQGRGALVQRNCLKLP